MRRKLPSKVELATVAVYDMADEARKDPARMYEMVIREETTRAPLKTTPHQEVMFSFSESHEMSGIRIPIGHGKTFFIGATSLFLLGKNRTKRGAIVSEIEKQSKKVLKMVADYIEDPTLNAPLAVVFPDLRRTQKNDGWSTVALTVDRPRGIRDPSLVAVGINQTIDGSRLAFAAADDIISSKTTHTKEMCEEQFQKLQDNTITRLDYHSKPRMIVCNTPWSRHDLTYILENREGWPFLTMDIYGNIRVSNPKASWMAMALDKYLRPSRFKMTGGHDWYRLSAHDPDPDETTPLFPERYTPEIIEGMKRNMTPHTFARSCLCEPLSDDALRCQAAWIERCKLRGVGLGFVHTYNGPNPTFTGVDIGIGRKSGHDPSVLSTIELHPDASARILDIESGRFSGPTIIEKIIDRHNRYHSVIAVENNSAQDFIRQFAGEAQKDMKVEGRTTGRNKHDEHFGVESIFTEIHNGAWIFPCDDNGKVHPELQKLFDDCLFYQPSMHTGDHLMSLWIARTASRESTGDRNRPGTGRKRELSSTGGF